MQAQAQEFTGHEEVPQPVRMGSSGAEMGDSERAAVGSMVGSSTGTGVDHPGRGTGEAAPQQPVMMGSSEAERGAERGTNGAADGPGRAGQSGRGTGVHDSAGPGEASQQQQQQQPVTEGGSGAERGTNGVTDGEASQQQQPVKVLISGAGPAGLMLAHCLLSLGGGKFRVAMYDKAQDPRELLKEGMSHRRYSIGLSKRAESCFRLVPGLLGTVKDVSIFAESVSLFLGLGKGPVSTRLREKDALSAWVVDRVSLCCKLLQSLLDAHGHDALYPGSTEADPKEGDAQSQDVLLPQGNAGADLEGGASPGIDARLQGSAEGDLKENAVLPGSSRDSEGSSSLLRIRFNCACTAIDLQNKVAWFSSQPTPSQRQGSDSGPLEAPLQQRGSGSCPAADAEGTPETSSGRRPSKADGGAENRGNLIEEHYDLLVGADGLRSAVRAAFIEQVRNFEVEQRVLAGEWAVAHLPCPPRFPRGTLHMFPVVPNSGGINGLAIPSPDGTLCLIWAWLINDDPSSWFSCKTPEEAHRYIDSRLPHFKIPQEAAWKLRCTPSQTSMHVKCWQYHEPSGHAVLIGDAAHATAPSIGQGCNASLVDACVLARLLLGEAGRGDNRVVDVFSDRTEHSVSGGAAHKGSAQRTFWAQDPSPDLIVRRLPSLLERFSALQVVEGHALVELSGSAGPLAPWARILHGVLFFGRTILCNLLPFLVSPPVMSLAATTVLPYSTIRSKFWFETALIQWSNGAVRRVCELAKAALVLRTKLC